MAIGYAATAYPAGSSDMKILKLLVVLLILISGAAVLFLFEGDIPKDVIDAKYSNHSSQFITLENQSTIHFRDEGNRSGEPVVLIHGFGASLHTWSPWVKLLGDEFRIVTLDLPAFGLTGAIPGDDYTTSGYIDTVNMLVDHLGLTSFTLVGNSMGGYVSWQYALKHPARVRALILIGSSGPGDWQKVTDEDTRPLIFSLLTKPWFQFIGGKLDPWYLISPAVKSAYNHSPAADQELIFRYYQLALREGTREAIIHRSVQIGLATEPSVNLSSLTQPVLVMWGREDALIDVETALRFDKVLPNSSVIIYDDVGHIPMEEIPERSAADVRKFMLSLNTQAIK